ncbi:MAG: hypothetical protein QOH97_2232 [Actinoplanes sp.]|jgi:hypothetical protein|nr:hypothetical protein [Actinoplanes sp.]
MPQLTDATVRCPFVPLRMFSQTSRSGRLPNGARQRRPAVHRRPGGTWLDWTSRPVAGGSATRRLGLAAGQALLQELPFSVKLAGAEKLPL